MSAVLKAGAAPIAEHARALQATHATLPAPQPSTPQPPGRWLTEADLESMLADAFDQGARSGQKQAEQQLRELARREAADNADRVLQRALVDHREALQRGEAARWQALSEQLADQMRSLRAELEAEVTEWTFVATTRLLGLISKGQVHAAVLHVLAEAGLRGPVQVHVHPKDHEILSTDSSGVVPDVQFVADAKVEVGGFFIRTPQQVLDARLEVQLALLRQALDVERRERHRAGD